MSNAWKWIGSNALVLLALTAQAQPTKAPERGHTQILQQKTDEEMLRCRTLRAQINQARGNPGNEVNRVMPVSNLKGQHSLTPETPTDNRRPPETFTDNRRTFEAEAWSLDCPP